MSILVAPGTSSLSIVIQIVDDTGDGVTGLIASTFPAIYYSIAGANAAVSISLSDLAAITTAYTSGGVKELSGGYYRLDVPNLAIAALANVTIYGEATGQHVIAEILSVQFPQVWQETTIHRGIGTSGASNQTMYLDSGASHNNGAYLGCYIQITSGTGSDWGPREINGYLGSTQEISIIPAWPSTPPYGAPFIIFGSALSDVCATNQYATASNGTYSFAAQTTTQATIAGIANASIVTRAQLANASTADGKTLLIAGANAATTFATLTITGAFSINGNMWVAQSGDVYSLVVNDIAPLIEGCAQPGDAMALTSDERTTLAGVIWSVLTSALTTAGSIGKLLASFIFDGSGNVKSAPQTGVNVTQWNGGALPTIGTSTLTADDLAAALTSYGAAKPGAQMDLVDAPNATAVAAIQDGLATETNATENMQAIIDHGDTNWEGGGGSSGDGSVPVNQDTGGTDNLRVVVAGVGVQGCIIRAYLQSDYADGDRTVRGQSSTGPDGRWLLDMMLDPATYIVTFSALGYELADAEVTIGG